MTPLPEAESIDAVRRALEPLRKLESCERDYLWDVVGIERVQWDDVGAERLSGKDECLVVFDPNEWNMPARLAVAQLASRDDAPVAYRCVRDEAKRLFSQAWTPNADFYVLSTDGRLLGMRTHEDVGSTAGMWIPKDEMPNKAPEPMTTPVTSRAPSSTSRAGCGRVSGVSLSGVSPWSQRGQSMKSEIDSRWNKDVVDPRHTTD